MKKCFTLLSLLALSLTASAQLTLHQPETKVATDITAKGFTANWGAVENAEGYCVFVYNRKPVTADGEVTIVDEDFNGITTGSLNEPEGGDEEYVDLSAYAYATTYGWSAYGFPNFIPSMVAGLIYSPYLDLRGNNGRYKVIVSAYCSNGDEIRMESNGRNGKEIQVQKAEVPGGAQGIADVEFEFNNGSKDLFFSVINNTAKDGAPDYFDRIRVTQQLKRGDVVNEMVGGTEAVDAVTESNDSITSCRIAAPSRYTSSKVLYYDVYASAADWSTPNGSIPYTFVVSDFTKLVQVDLATRTSQIFDETTGVSLSAVSEVQSRDNDAWYNLSGQRVTRPSKGIFIHNGQKVVLK